jgi:superfamily I DNA/RNA helicase
MMRRTEEAERGEGGARPVGRGSASTRELTVELDDGSAPAPEAERDVQRGEPEAPSPLESPAAALARVMAARRAAAEAARLLPRPTAPLADPAGPTRGTDPSRPPPSAAAAAAAAAFLPGGGASRGAAVIPPRAPPEEVARQAAQREVALRKGAPWQPPAYLPEDLQEALLAERSQYRAQLLQGVRDVARDAPGVLGVTPIPAADPDWTGGKLLAFVGEECVFAGDVVHLDLESGRVFTASDEGEKVDNRALRAERWCYKPFDFAEALCAAAGAYEERKGELALALLRAEGKATPASPAPSDASLLEEERVWRQPWGCIWGPPGTGKTTSVAGLIARAVRARPHERILAVAPTNRAADELAVRVARLLELDPPPHRPLAGSVFRGGTGAGEQLAGLPAIALEEHKASKLLQSIEERERAIAHKRFQRGPAHELASLQAELRSLRHKVKDPTLKEAEKGDSPLMVLTVHRALRLVRELEGKETFARLVVDEAGMVTRAAAAVLAPLAARVTLAGDPKQIGPVSRAAEGAGAATQRWLRASALSHLEDAGRDSARPDVLLLRTQHRMHPDISRVVSAFCYAGQLADGPTVLSRAARPAPLEALTPARAGWVVLDGASRDARRLAHARGESGSGYQRELSAELAVHLAKLAVRQGLKVLCVTPYRAQANLLRRLGLQAGLRQEVFAASTIHRQQGTQYDVVLVDTVAGGRPFPPHTLVPLLNVAASRAQDYLFVLATREESRGAIPRAFLSLLPRLRVVTGSVEGSLAGAIAAKGEGGLRLEPLPQAKALPPPPVPVPPPGLGGEIVSGKAVQPLFTHEQLSLFDRRFDDGHHLVRGVAGSGKTYVLAHWAARYLLEHPEAEVLVSFYNRALAPLVDKLVAEALVQRAGLQQARALRRQVTVRHVSALRRCEPGSFDAVFVDEAQDMDAKALGMLHGLAREHLLEDGKRVRCFHLFMDDSQNVYGQTPLEAMREELPEGLSFRGRTRVLKETFRATRDILDVAFNVVLDPLKAHGDVLGRPADPGMREYMKVGELAREGLLLLPEETLEGLFRLQSTERGGVPPTVKGFANTVTEARWIAKEVARLVKEEGVHPGDVLVVAPVMPATFTDALRRAGVPAEAYGGKNGRDVADFRVSGVDHVRATTVFSCKGHECPVVFFAGLEALDTIEQWMAGAREKNARENERVRRAMFYVGATRAMKRQYLTGVRGGRFLQVAERYVEALSGLAPG